MKWLSKGIVFCGLLLMAGFFMLFWPGTGTSFVEIDVNDGMTAHQIATKMEEADLIRLRHPFIFWVKIKGAQQKIQVGRYRFSEGRSAFWLVDDLVSGRVQKTRFVIPEGFASWQIAERLDEAQICVGEEFRDAVVRNEWEGFLFPATYELSFGLKAEKIARIFIQEFEERWTPELEARAAELNMTKKAVVTLASIVEREVRVRDELPLVAAVYLNRLKKGMKLEADPTVQFALGYWKSRLTYDDYRKTVSPYNTYLNFGLPPGPIASPGIDAMKAVLWPASSDALYFVAKEDGRHDFSANFRDHANKVNKRNKLRKQQK